MTVMIERYVMLLKECNGRGDVMAEWRGAAPNMRLERSFSRLYIKGSGNVTAAEMKLYLSSSQLKIAKKEANIAGLQLSDLIAHPARTQLICQLRNEEMRAPFGKEVVRILIEQKYRRSPAGVIEGFGVKLLP
jgi:hypothetical protein